MAKDRYGESIGIWHLTVGGADLDLKPTADDYRKFRDLMSNKEIQKDRPLLFNKFEEFMLGLIQEVYPSITGDEEKRQKEYVAMHTINLLTEATVAFRMATKEDIEKAKKESVRDLKKSIESG